MNKPSIKLPNPQEAYAPFVQRLNAGENAAQLVEEAYEQGVEDFRAALIACANEYKEVTKQTIREEQEKGEAVSKVIGVVGTVVLVIMALAVIVQHIFFLIT